jgi:hypothetical protein
MKATLLWFAGRRLPFPCSNPTLAIIFCLLLLHGYWVTSCEAKALLLPSPSLSTGLQHLPQ